MASSTFHKRPACARREQKLRAEARTVQRLIKGVASLDAHRGSQTSRLGAALAMALQQPPTPVSQPLCRHFARGNCTWVDRCRFRHGDPPALGADADLVPPQPCAATVGLPLTCVLPPAPEDDLRDLLDPSYCAAAPATEPAASMDVIPEPSGSDVAMAVIETGGSGVYPDATPNVVAVPAPIGFPVSLTPDNSIPAADCLVDAQWSPLSHDIPFVADPYWL